jgi:copper chaperone CopZ
LLKLNEVNNVEFNLSTSSVKIHFTGDKDNEKRYRQVLAEMGYPEKGNNNSIYVFRSFFSCVRGRIKP